MGRERDNVFANRLGLLVGSAAVLVGFALVATARAEDATGAGARAALDLAESAATAWAEDAQLVYVESDEPLASTGECARWGYLFFSKALGRGRAYSIEGDDIEVAEDFPFEFDAPPLPREWIDSADAVRNAAQSGGADAGDHAAAAPHLASMFLVRGVLNTEDPDAATWGLVYEAGTAPKQIVVMDARTGKFVRRWRG
ncbi:MAG: hypothetical protein ACKVU1_06085 [bacterium]